MITFENYHRKIEKINRCFLHTTFLHLRMPRQSAKKRESTHTKSQRKFSRSALRMYAGHMLPARLSQVQFMQVTRHAQSAKAFRRCFSGFRRRSRKVGSDGNLAATVSAIFAFLAGHESFAAAEGAIGIAKSANKVRTKPLRVILNGLGKDAAQIISRINGFTYVQTQFDSYRRVNFRLKKKSRIPRVNARKSAAMVPGARA